MEFGVISAYRQLPCLPGRQDIVVQLMAASKSSISKCLSMHVLVSDETIPLLSLWTDIIV